MLYQLLVFHLFHNIGSLTVFHPPLSPPVKGGAFPATALRSVISVKNVVFIDAISQTIKKTPKETDGCYFVSSPSALTELSLTISKFIRHNFDYLIFDSLTNLLIYEKQAPVAKFVSSLTNKIKASKTKAIFYALSINDQETMIQECSMFVDSVIDLGKKKK